MQSVLQLVLDPAAADIEIQAQEILRLRENLNGILAHHCKTDVKNIEKDTQRDYFMSAAEAKDYGLVDAVVEPKALKDAKKKA